MRYFTAVFGESHRRVAHGLVRTFKRYGPNTPLTVFTDLVDPSFDNATFLNFNQLLNEYPAFYHIRGRRNIIKLRLFREMQRRFPEETIAWIDADMLVFDDLDKHLQEGVVNVIAHGRRNTQLVNCGDGLRVPGERYAIGGLFAIPPGPALAYLEHTTERRLNWHDDGNPNHMIGDQLILNHLVARGPFEVNWVTDNKRFVYNLEIGDGVHPGLNDEGLKRVRWYGKRPVTDGREVVVFCWIKRQVDLHIDNGFTTFHPVVSWRLRRLYSVPSLTSLPTPT
jgi:hypothetical protein